MPCGSALQAGKLVLPGDSYRCLQSGRRIAAAPCDLSAPTDYCGERPSGVKACQAAMPEPEAIAEGGEDLNGRSNRLHSFRSILGPFPVRFYCYRVFSTTWPAPFLKKKDFFLNSRRQPSAIANCRSQIRNQEARAACLAGALGGDGRPASGQIPPRRQP